MSPNVGFHVNAGTANILMLMTVLQQSVLTRVETRTTAAKKVVSTFIYRHQYMVVLAP